MKPTLEIIKSLKNNHSHFSNLINSSLDKPDCLIIEIKVPFGIGSLFGMITRNLSPWSSSLTNAV